MASLFQNLKDGIQTLPSDIRDLCVEAWKWAKPYRWFFVSLLAISLISAWLMLPHDAEWLDHIRMEETSPRRWIAEELSYWGDFPTGILLVFGILWPLSLLFKNSKLRRACVSFILAAAIAGLAVNSFRTTLGRPRPSSGLPDGLYGLKSGSEYHAFPSGHSATSFATAGTFIASAPVIGVPLTAVAAGVGWSRMALNRHHPTDILVGGTVGLIVGLSFGNALRRLEKDRP